MKKANKLLIGSAATASAVSLGAGYIIFNEVMNRNAKIFPLIKKAAQKKMVSSPVEETDPRLKWFYEQKPIPFEMINSRNFRLKAKLFPAEKPSKVFVFCSHGYKSTGFREYDIMTKFYHDLGYNVFIVDHQAHGESDGQYIGFGYYEYEDCLLWLQRLIDKYGDDIQIILQGISMGCATVTMMAGSPTLPKNVKFIVADCGYTTAKAQFEFVLKNYVHLPNFPLLYTANFFNKKIGGYGFTDSNPIDWVAKAEVPMLFVHGEADDFVPPYMVHQLYAACSSEYKDILVVKGAGHAESYRVGSEAYEEKVKSFCEKFITE